MDRQGKPSILHQLSAMSSLFHLSLLKLYWRVTNLVPSWRGVPKWSYEQAVGFRATRWFVGFAIRYQDLSTKDIKEVPDQLGLKKLNSSFVKIPVWEGKLAGSIGELAAKSGVKFIEIPGFWFGKEADKPGTKDRVLLYFHGGAYVIGSANPTDLFGFIPSSIPKHSQTMKHAISIEYRLSSSQPYPTASAFPTALVDAISSFHYLLNLGFLPQNVYISGDSAGANLALALARYLVEEEVLALGGLILASPWADLTDSHDGRESSRAQYRDVDLLSNNVDSDSYALRSFLAGSTAENVYISPACKRLQPSFTNFPRTFVTWGEVETLKDEIVTLCGRMEHAVRGGLARAEVPDSPHDTCLLATMSGAREALVSRIAQWVDAE